MPDIKELRQKSDKLTTEARSILDAVPADENLSSEDEVRFDQLMEDADRVDSTIEREEKLRKKERVLAGLEIETGPRDETEGNEERDGWFGRYLRGGLNALTSDERALALSPNASGGYLQAPQEFIEELIQKMDDAHVIRGLATGHQLEMAESLGVPTIESDVDDFDWTSELATGTDDTGLTFGKRELRPHPMAKRVKVSKTLLRKGSMNPEQIVSDRLAYKVGTTQEKAYMTGDGNQKPLGLFVASANGISTGRDATFGASGAIPLTTATSDQIIDAKYTLKSGYHRNANWLFHRDILKLVRKIKDSNGQYIWRPGMNGDPATLDDIPVVLSEFAPNTVANNAYVGMLGDFSHYWYVDSLEFQIQKLVELYAESNQDGFIARYEGDGMPVLEEAFVRLQVPA